MKTLYLYLYLFVLIALFSTTFSQEIPNGDGDLLWERSIYPRFVNDAKFHPINGNIIAAVNHEIWEIDPIDGHTIRVFEGETGIEFNGWIDISSDGNYIILSNGGGTNLKLYDYNLGKLVKYINMGPWSTVDFFPNSMNILFHQARQFFIYDVLTDKLVKESKTLSSEFAIMRFKLSKDGKNIAVGKSYLNGEVYTMELWDAETLTKIRDFGEAEDIVEFCDIQISDNNQYVGFCTQGPTRLYFFDNLKNHNIVYEGGFTLAFTKDCKYFFIQQDTSWNKIVSFITRISDYSPIYEFKKFSPYNYQFNEKNELFGGRENLLFFSSNWYSVGVNEHTKDILRISYSNFILSILIPQGIIPEKILVIDTVGKVCYNEKVLNSNNNEIIRNISLPSGTYFLTITTTTGQEISQKFIVTE